MRHIVDTKNGEWFHKDELNRLWSCGCKDTGGVSLCLSICDCLKDEGELREVKRQIAMKRKELGLLVGE